MFSEYLNGMYGIGLDSFTLVFLLFSKKIYDKDGTVILFKGQNAQL